METPCLTISNACGTYTVEECCQRYYVSVVQDGREHPLGLRVGYKAFYQARRVCEAYAQQDDARRSQTTQGR